MSTTPSTLPRSPPYPRASSSTYTHIPPARSPSPKRVKATPSPSSPSRGTLQYQPAQHTRPRNRGKRADSAATAGFDRHAAVTPGRTPELEDGWRWPARRREMSVPLLSQTLSHFSLSQTSPPFAAPSEVRHPMHHSTPPATSMNNLFSPGPAAFTPRRAPRSPISQTPFGVPLPRDHVYPSSAPLPHMSAFLGSPFSAKTARGRYEYHTLSPSKGYYRGAVTERVDQGYFDSALEVQEGSEWMVDDLLGPVTSDEEDLGGVPGIPRSRRDTSGSSSSVDDFSGSGTSLASLLSSGRRSGEHHTRPSVVTVWDHEEQRDDDEDNSTPSRQLFMATERLSSKTACPSPAHALSRHHASSFETVSVIQDDLTPSSVKPQRSPLSAIFPRLLSSRKKSRSSTRSPANDDAGVLTDVEDAYPPAPSSMTAFETSSPLVSKAERLGGIGLGLYSNKRRPFQREKTVTIDMARSISSESSTEIDQSPSRPLSSGPLKSIQAPKLVAPSLIRRKTDSPEEVGPPAQLGSRYRPGLRRGITEPRLVGSKNAFLSPAVHTPIAAMFSDAKPSPAAFASTGLIKKRSGLSAVDLPRFGDSEPNKPQRSQIGASPSSPIENNSHVAPLPIDAVSMRTVSSSSAISVGSVNQRGKGLRRKGSTMFAASTSVGGISDAGSPVTPTKLPFQSKSVGVGVCTPSPTCSSAISYPFASSTGSLSPPIGEQSESPSTKSTLPARVRQLSSRYGPVARASNPMLAAAYKAQATPNASTGVPVSQKRGRLDQDFIIVNSMGKGEFSQVWKVKDRAEGKCWAVKAGKPYTGMKNRLRQLEEVSILRQLSLDPHSNVISYVDSWEHSSRLFIRTELLPCGDLSRFLAALGDNNGLGEARVWKTLDELAAGISHIHGHNYLHLDLKPSNVLITSAGSLKIADFGMSTLSSAEGSMVPLSPALPDIEADGGFVWATKTGELGIESPILDREIEGDREYLCPEALAGGSVGRPADVYSLGILLLEAALNVVLPSNGEGWVKLRSNDFSDLSEHYQTRPSFAERVLEEQSTDSADETLPVLSATLVDTIQRLMASDPASRMTLTEVAELDAMRRLRGMVGQSAALVEVLDEEMWLRSVLEN